MNYLQNRLLTNVIITILVLLGIVGLRHLALLIVWKKTDDVKKLYSWRKISGYVSSVVAILTILLIWGSGIKSLSTFLGLFSAGVAIALRGPIENLAGWFFIMIRRPFELGDRIQIGDVAGDVVDIRSFQFTLIEIGNWVDADQSTGRIIHIPNKQVFNSTLANYTTGFRYIWDELAVVVTFDSNWQKAKDILLDVANRYTEGKTEQARQQLREVARRYMIYYHYLTPTVYTSVVDNGIKLTIRYLCEPRKRRGIRHNMWEDILNAFAMHDDIEFAYPTQQIYYTPTQRKEREKDAGPEENRR